jgi:beta-aspartyl-peptidase (threonine type)
MSHWAIAVHGGAGPDSNYIKQNIPGYENGLRIAITAAQKILEKGGCALDAVEEAVRCLEDDPLFNAGRGSALNNKGEVEMDASIMDGERVKAGAISMVKNVKHPISLARLVMDKTNHVLLSGYGATELAKDNDIELETDTYFITTHQHDLLMESREKESMQELLQKKIHGTVGAVALDKNGNLASATSTGGMTNSLPGRIGDSCIIGAGCYAKNSICAVSGTGDGELLITNVIAYDIVVIMELKNYDIQQACDFVIHEKNKKVNGDIGVISVDANGNFGISFNSERMHRAWMCSEVSPEIKIYR